uniref:ODAD1 central coiled coil region domain-containing protein n=1 Tax=Globisporangium ultimum (strain ATCC 200006 / CBS 805.95 / DAOM BR144) TaxID=431595 RepID=K3WV37_GLOUD
MAKSNVRAQSDQLFNLQVQGDKYARLLMAQKHRLRQLDAHWKKVADELKELRLKRGEGDQRGGGANAVRARMADEQRELMKLENRLSSCRTRDSKMFAINADLRQRVDELRASRVLSQTIFEKNQKKLREIQKQMQENFRTSTQIMAERDRILAQAHSLTHTNMEEQEGFDSVYQSLASIIKRERENAESYRKQVLEQDPMDLTDDFVRGNMKLEDEVQLKNNLKRLDMNLLEDKQSIESINDRLQEFDTTFTSLQQQMEVGNYHDLVDAYTKKDEENFALFRYVQSINNEIEQLEDEKHALEKETQKLSNDMKDGNAHARKRMIDDLVEVRQKILKENSEYERLRAASVREFQPIARAVDRLYNALGCNDVMPPGVGAGGGNNGDASKRSRKQSDDQIAMMARINSMNDLLAAHGITEGNILQFLAIIEQRSSELIEQFSRRLQCKNPMESSRASLGANLHPSDPNRSISAARAILPGSSGNVSVGYSTTNSGLLENAGSQAAPATSSNNHISLTSIGNSAMPMDSLLTTSGANFSASIAEEDPMPNVSDDEESDRPMTKAELQKRAAKTVAGLQLNPKPQSVRMKAVATKKKK